MDVLILSIVLSIVGGGGEEPPQQQTQHIDPEPPATNPWTSPAAFAAYATLAAGGLTPIILAVLKNRRASAEACAIHKRLERRKPTK